MDNYVHFAFYTKSEVINYEYKSITFYPFC